MSFPETLKAQVRQKAHYQCCLCKSLGVEIHHIIPQEEGGPDTEDNAAPLCPSCHETYGANPQKRKFIREARDHWFKICATRFGSDTSTLDEIKVRLERTITLEDFERLKGELMDTFMSTLQAPRTEEEIIRELDILWDKIWYNRHKIWRQDVEAGAETVSPELWRITLAGARRMERKHGKDNLGPWTDFEWGMLNGKLSALRWVMGDEWDFLDT